MVLDYSPNLMLTVLKMVLIKQASMLLNRTRIAGLEIECVSKKPPVAPLTLFLFYKNNFIRTSRLKNRQKLRKN